MKTIFKILVILVVAAFVGGLFYGAVTLTSSGSGQASVQERRPGGDRDGSSGGVQIPVDMLKNFAIISVIVVGYLNAAKFFSRKQVVLPLRS